MKKALICLMLMGSLIAQDLSNRSQQPKPKVPFKLTYEHIPDIFLRYHEIKGNKNKLIDNLFNLIDFFLDETNECVSLEINPLFVYESSVKVIDCVMERKVF